MGKGGTASAPPTDVLAGHLWSFNRDRLGFLLSCAREYGDIVPLRFGARRFFLMSHPSHVREVFVDRARDFRKGYSVRLLRYVLGNGLLLNEGEHWRQRRRAVQPYLHRERVADYAGFVREALDRMLARWSDGDVRDVYLEMAELTMSAAARVLLGVDVAAEPDGAAVLREAVHEAASDRPLRFVPITRYLPTSANRREAAIVRRLDRYVRDLIREQRTSAGVRGGMLACLAKSDDRTSERQLRDDIVTLFFGAYDTTASALAWTLYLLGSHPDARARLDAELDAVLAARPPVADDLRRLPFTHACVHEALRLYPSAWAESREAVRDTEIGGQRIRAGTTVVVSQWVVQRDRRFFDEPDRFAPERWCDGLADRLPKFAYFPFGAGARQCVGAAFAMMEAVLVVAAMSQRFRLVPVAGHPAVPEAIVTLRPKYGLPMTIQARHLAATSPA